MAAADARSRRLDRDYSRRAVLAPSELASRRAGEKSRRSNRCKFMTMVEPCDLLVSSTGALTAVIGAPLSWRNGSVVGGWSVNGQAVSVDDA